MKYIWNFKIPCEQSSIFYGIPSYKYITPFKLLNTDLNSSHSLNKLFSLWSPLLHNRF